MSSTAQLTTENPLIEGLERLPVRSTVLIIFGGTGDLAARKLLPAIYNRLSISFRARLKCGMRFARGISTGSISVPSFR